MSKYFQSASLILTENCNLNCDYCYEHCKNSEKVMTLETAKKSVDFLIKGAKHNGDQSIYIYYFGGEPLMNFPVMRDSFYYAVQRTKEEGLFLNCKLISNGTLFPDGYAEFLKDWSKECKERHIQLSMDGIPAVQDAHRVTKGERHGSSELFEKTLKKYKEVAANLGLELGKDIMLHSVVTRESLPHLVESYDYIRSLGFPGYEMPAVVEEPWTDEDVAIFKDQFRAICGKIAGECIRHNDTKYYDLMTEVTSRFTMHPTKSCGAGESFCTITTDGKVYPCHRFALGSADDLFLLGTIDDDYDVLDEKRDLFIQITYNNMMGDKSCGSCDNYSCRSCLAANYEVNGNVALTNPDYCKVSRARQEVKMELQSHLIKMGLLQAVPTNCDCHGDRGCNSHNISQGDAIAELNQNLKAVLGPLNAFYEKIDKQIQDNNAELQSISIRVQAITEVLMSFIGAFPQLLEELSKPKNS